MTKKHLTFDFVEDKDFRDYSRGLNSKAKFYNVRSIQEAARKQVLKKQLGLTSFMKGKQGTVRAADTHDSWTSKGGHTYASLSYHFLAEDFTLFSCPFDIKRISGHTYASCIAETIHEMGQFRGIASTVSCTDCEWSMVAAWRELNHCGQGCVCHRIEKITGVFFDCPGHKATMTKARKLAGHFHHSTQAKSKLKELGAIMLGAEHPSGLATLQDVITRWWSTYNMCERLMVLRGVLQALEAIEGGIYVPEDVRLTNAEWAIVEMGRLVLKPFMQAQKVFEGELYGTNALVIPIIFQLRSMLIAELARQEHMLTLDVNATNIVQCLRLMVAALLQRFGDGTNVVPFNTPHGNAVEGARRQPCGMTLWQAYATCMDVRTKDLYGIPIPEHAALWDRVRDFAVELAMESYARVQADAVVVGAAAGVAPAPAAPPAAPAAVEYGFDRPVAAQAPVAPVLDMAEHFRNCVRIELINWQAVPLVNNPFYDNLEWWKGD